MENIAVQGGSFFKLEDRFLVLPGSLPKAPRLWYKSTIVEKDINNKVVQILDLSGNNDNLIQEAQSYKPTWVDNQLNGYPSVYFNASNSENMVIQLDNPVMQPYTIFTVFGNPIRLTGSRFLYDTIPSGAYRQYIAIDTVNEGADGIIFSSGINTPKYHIAHPFDPIVTAFGVVSGRSRSYVNNVLHLADANSGGSLFAGMTVATRYNLTVPAHVNLYEFILFDSALTEFEINNINIELMVKYAL